MTFKLYTDVGMKRWALKKTAKYLRGQAVGLAVGDVTAVDCPRQGLLVDGYERHLSAKKYHYTFENAIFG